MEFDSRNRQNLSRERFLKNNKKKNSNSKVRSHGKHTLHTLATASNFQVSCDSARFRFFFFVALLGGRDATRLRKKTLERMIFHAPESDTHTYT